MLALPVVADRQALVLASPRRSAKLLKAGDAVFFVCGKPDKAAKLAGAARIRIGKT